MRNDSKINLKFDLKKRIIKILFTFLISLAAIWVMSKTADYYKLADYYVVLGALPFAIIYLYQIFSLFGMKCPHCKKSIFGSIYSGKIGILFDKSKNKKCYSCGKELW